MFTYNMEYRENILFIRLIGSLNKYTIKCLSDELENIVYNLGIYNIVFNFEQLEEIDKQATKKIVEWYNIIRNRKGVSLACGLNNVVKRKNLLRYMQEINNELCAIKMINWNN